MRVAFLTPEFVLGNDRSGGLATYLARISVELQGRGHEVEVFTVGMSDVADYQGVRVESVNNFRRLPIRVIRKCVHLLPRMRVESTTKHLAGAHALAGAFKRRHAVAPFDVVQSSNFGLAGYFVPRDLDVRHLVRCSSSRKLWRSVGDRPLSSDHRLMDHLEQKVMRRADAVYAPSRFLADHLQQEHGIPVETICPPLPVEFKCADEPPCPLPDRYLVHFGLLGVRKGTDLVLQAAHIASAEATDFRIVLVGNEAGKGKYEQMLAAAGGPCDNITWIGALERPQLYRVVSDALASVLPSRVDNLPNTLIESLGLRVPVIGSDGASINELVLDGVNGRLVPIDDAHALAAAMLDAWRSTEEWDLQAFATDQFVIQPERDPIESFLLIASGVQTESSRGETHRENRGRDRLAADCTTCVGPQGDDSRVSSGRIEGSA